MPPVVYPSPSAPAVLPYASQYQGVATSAIPSVVPMTAHAYHSGVGQSSSPVGVAFSGQASVAPFSGQASVASFSNLSSPAPFSTLPSPAPFSTQASPPFSTQSIHGSYGPQTKQEPVPTANTLSPAMPLNVSTVPIEVLKNQIRQKFNYERIPDYDKLEFGITDTQNSQNTSQLSAVCSTNTSLNNIIPSFASSPLNPPTSPCFWSWRTADWSHQYCSPSSSPGYGNADPPY